MNYNNSLSLWNFDEGGDVFIPGTKLFRLRLVNLGKRGS
jgi:hypothetical protein